MQDVQTLLQVALKCPVSITLSHTNMRLTARFKKQVFRMRLTVDMRLITMCA